jgi:hypothetical protein
MAGQSRTLKLAILGDVDQLKKSLKTGTTEVEGFGNKIGDFSKKAGIAFAVAGAAAAAYAGKLLIDGVKAAVEDEKANALLANTLRNVAGATDETIEKTLAYTRATELATGVTEDELRPSLNRLTIATGSVQKAMQLQTLALDVSAGSGKSLEAVTQALAKAQEGNTASLGRLGVGLTAAQLKTMSMDDVTKSLAATFAGAADTAANTFEGKINRLNLAFEDVRDSVGGFVLDAITPMVENIVTKVMPALATFADGLGKSLGPAFNSIGKVIREDVLPIIRAWYGFIVDVIIPGITAIVRPVFEGLVGAFKSITNAVSANSDELKPLLNLFKVIAEFVRDDLAPILGGAFKLALQAIGNIVAGLVTGFSNLVGFITQTINKIKEFVNFVKDNPVTRFFFGASDTGAKGLRAGGITQSGFFANEFMGAERQDDNPFFNFNGQMVRGVIDATGISDAEANFRQQEALLFRMKNPDVFGPVVGSAGNAQPSLVVNVNGAIDPERTARQIYDLVNDSFYRGTGGALNFVGAS